MRLCRTDLSLFIIRHVIPFPSRPINAICTHLVMGRSVDKTYVFRIVNPKKTAVNREALYSLERIEWEFREHRTIDITTSAWGDDGVGLYARR